MAVYYANGGNHAVPCPRCIGDGTANDGTLGGTCSGGPRNGLSCDASGDVPGHSGFGVTSLDCPPNGSGGSLLGVIKARWVYGTADATKTLSGTSLACQGAAGRKCFCGTCNTAAGEPCFANSDCPVSGGSAGICDGKRCVGGANVGTPCTAHSQCPSGSCSRPENPAQPSSCLDDTTTPEDERLCVDSSPTGDHEGQCPTSGAFCYLDNGDPNSSPAGALVAEGDVLSSVERDAYAAQLATVFCQGTAAAATVRSWGLPGPGRLVTRSGMQFLP